VRAHYHEASFNLNEVNMNDLLLRAYIAVQSLVEREEGQDLVEYSLVIALIAFGGITGMKTLSTGLNHAFSQISVTVTTNVT
jgi:pilus assembly protein Flp/PilA